ncbi:MAG TPA: hypothetical protein VJ806_08345 [Luteimonas sp.]|nr:hypothetical protein [Luteimonas sp.]
MAVADRLEIAWKVLHGALSLSDREFWIVFDEVEARTLIGLQENDLIQAIEGLHAHAARLKGRGRPIASHH